MNTVNLQSKVILLGSGGVGKTSLLQRYLGEKFLQQYRPTIGAEFYTDEKKFSMEKGDFVVKTHLWDLAGQPRFRDVVSNYFTGASGALVVFDISKRETLQMAKKWVERFYSTANHDPTIVLCGNKIDLRPLGQGEISSEEGAQMAEQLSKLYEIEVPYIETSAKTRENVDKAFKMTMNKVVMQMGAEAEEK